MTQRDRAYKEAGVDIEAGNTFVRRIKPLVNATHTKGVMSDIGGFGGLFRPDISNMDMPVLVSATDGVGTKLKLCFEFNRHSSIGRDLVAMNVNDVLVQGGKPLFFLDYLAAGKLDPEIGEQIISGIAAGCKEAKCALLGGETAEMPDFYPPGEYDLSGFCVGIVDRDKIVDGTTIRSGHKLIGLGSSGLHSNGFSLVRKVLAASGLSGSDPFPGTDRTVADVLLEPTRIYVRPVQNLLRDMEIRGMVHVTGGGFYDNLPRILYQGLCADIDFGSWDIPPVFDWLRREAGLEWEEMLKIFNCGVGYILVVSEDECDDILPRLQGMDIPAWVIGRISRGKKNVSGEEQVRIGF
ncbi:MAG: phosphoribosylformylglycinamidine cyclo-ligase [Desulfonatronovibrionaceae bacterium]